ncbi:MAG: hypothetical protein ACREDY_27110 [Bradyrhizobium sp.]
MKFKIRDNFSIHLEIATTRTENGKAIRSSKVEPHFGGETLELQAEDANKHLHKLEPLDKEAVAFLEVQYELNRQIASNHIETQDIGKLAALVASEVARAMAAAGVGVPPKQR